MNIRTQNGASALLAIFVLAAQAPIAAAEVAPNTLPSNGTVTAGSATITQPSTNKLQINQSSDKAVIDWRSYSIGSQAWVNYTMPGAGSVSLNRVTGGDVSHILGKLTANGTVMLINPNGIVFGKGSTIDVAGLVATTANIRNDDFMAGRMRFTTPGKPNATIINEGTITIREAGLAALVAPGVDNRGVIEATLGKVSLGAGNTFTLDFYGDGLIKLAVTDPVTVAALGEGQPLVRNSGTIKADGGKVLITANAAKNVVDTVINMDGVIQARRVSQQADGTIVLDGGAHGEVKVAGRLDVSAPARGVDAGKITVTGEKVRIASAARIDATALSGKGGEVKIGGDYQGKGSTRQARLVTVDAGAIMDASAIERGDGGTVVVWSTEHTKFSGTILAKGGLLSGNGGLVETSGKILEVGDGALVSTLAPNGKTGNWLLDPVVFIIDLAGADGVGCVVAVCTISPATLEAALALSNVTLQADNGVFFNADVTYTGPNTLTLNIGCACTGGILEIADSVTVTISNLFLTSPRVDDAVGITINYAGVTLGTLNVTTLTLQTDVDFTGATTWNGTRPTTVNVVKHPDNPSQTPINLATEPQGGKIQDGLDIVATNGTVNVGTGTFVEQLLIERNVTLNGANAGLSASDALSGRGTETIVQGPDAGGADLVRVRHDLTAVTIDGFLFDGRDSAVGAQNWNVGVHATYTASGTYNLAIRNSIFRGFIENGVQVEGRDGIRTIGLVITQNSFTNIGCGCLGEAILLKKNVFGTISSNLIAEDVPFITAGEGLVGNGITIRNYDMADAGDTLLISNNTISGFETTGLTLNRLDAGIFTINANAITGSTSVSSDTGISIVNSAAAMTFTNNTVQDTDIGIDILRGSGNYTFAGQTILNTVDVAVLVARHSGNIDFTGTIDITSGALFVLTDNTGGTKSFTGAGTGFRSLGGDTAIIIAGNTGGTYTIANATITDPTADAVIISRNLLDTAAPSITLRNFAITVSDPLLLAIFVDGQCRCGNVGNILIDSTTITAAGTAIAIVNHIGTVTVLDTVIHANTSNSPGNFGIVAVSGGLAAGEDMTLVLDRVSIDLPTAAPALGTGAVLLFTPFGDGLVRLSVNPTDVAANRVSLTGGEVGLLIDGPNTRIVGDTLRDTVFTGYETLGLFYIRLQCCALFEPGQPTVIDISRSTFDGRAVTFANAAFLEERIEHFRDTPTLGLFLLPGSPPGSPTPRVDLNLVLAALLARNSGLAFEVKFFEPFQTSFKWPDNGPFDFGTFNNLFPIGTLLPGVTTPLGSLAPASGTDPAGPGPADGCTQDFMGNFWAWRTQCAAN